MTVESARRFQRRALLLDEHAPDVGTALAHHGYIQIDPINVCGRMHDLILRNRVTDYREGGLMKHLHGDGATLAAEKRVAFEHHLPSTAILAAFPFDAWPHLLGAMEARTRRAGPWSGRLTPRERELAAAMLAELEERGPLASDAFHDGRRARRTWGRSTLAKATLQKLFFHGRVLIAKRENNRRYYDLPERVLPAAVLAAARAQRDDTSRWLVVAKLRQRRLTALKRTELSLVEDCVQPVHVEGGPTVYCLTGDVPIFDELADGPSTELRLLAPLEPLIYDRLTTRQLWDFDYTWEAYTPAHKRVRGHYALPVLAGTEIVGYVDPKADREAGRLRVTSRRIRRGHKLTMAVRELAHFLELKM